jgi:hypothetical protein
MDAYSRRVVGWELSEDPRADLALAALDRALADRSIHPGIVGFVTAGPAADFRLRGSSIFFFVTVLRSFGSVSVLVTVPLDFIAF